MIILDKIIAGFLVLLILGTGIITGFEPCYYYSVLKRIYYNNLVQNGRSKTEASFSCCKMAQQCLLKQQQAAYSQSKNPQKHPVRNPKSFCRSERNKAVLTLKITYVPVVEIIAIDYLPLHLDYSTFLSGKNFIENEPLFAGSLKLRNIPLRI